MSPVPSPECGYDGERGGHPVKKNAHLVLRTERDILRMKLPTNLLTCLNQASISLTWLFSCGIKGQEKLADSISPGYIAFYGPGLKRNRR